MEEVIIIGDLSVSSSCMKLLQEDEINNLTTAEKYNTYISKNKHDVRLSNKHLMKNLIIGLFSFIFALIIILFVILTPVFFILILNETLK